MFKVLCQITGLSIIQIPCLFSSCCLWEVKQKAHGGFHFCRPIMSTPGPISGEWGTRTGVPVSPSWSLPVFTWMWTATGRHRTAMKVFIFSAKNQMVIGYSEGIGNKFSGINYYTSPLTFITSNVSWVAENKIISRVDLLMTGLRMFVIEFVLWIYSDEVSKKIHSTFASTELPQNVYGLSRVSNAMDPFLEV